MTQGSRLLRAAGFGIAIAFLLGGAYILYTGLVGTFGSPDCSNLSPTECGFARENALSVGRMQLIFGGAMVALSLAIYALWRSRFVETTK